MARCGGCGAESSRVRTVLTDSAGKLLPEPKETCKSCDPESFDRWVDPSNKHGGFRWQYEPWKYKKRVQPDGSVLYEAKDERNSDLEAQLSAPSPYKEQKRAEALEHRRKHRRTEPLREDEKLALINKGLEIKRVLDKKREDDALRTRMAKLAAGIVD